MPNSSLVRVFAGLLVVGWLIALLYRIVKSPLRRVPGPFLARFTDLWYAWRVWRGHFQYDNIALHRKYGKLVRYGPNRYSINDTQAIKIVYGHGTSFPKSSWYDSFGVLDPEKWGLFMDRDIQRHARNRRQFQNTFSMSSLITYEPYVDESAHVFEQRLQELADTGVPVDMGHWFQCYAFDVIGMITYSRRLGFLDMGKDVGGIIKALEETLIYGSLVGIYAFLHRYLFPLQNWWAGYKGSGREFLLRFTNDRIVEHQAALKKVPEDPEHQVQGAAAGVDFLTKFYAKHSQDPVNFTKYHVLAGCTANMSAGSDTTAITLSAILYYLLRNPQIYKKLVTEIDTFYDQGRGSTSVSFKESLEMPYLQAVIKEAFRIHPAVGLPLERVVPHGGATICGFLFPEGTIVGVNSWVEHRNKTIWGQDADQFRPERWFTDDKERLSLMTSHWIPFGTGSRTCIGRHYSTLEISKLIPRLLRTFDFELAGGLDQPQRSWDTLNHWFVKLKGFVVKVKVRQLSSDQLETNRSAEPVTRDSSAQRADYI